MEQMRQRLKRSEQSEQERCKIGSRLFCAFELLRFFWVSLSLCALSAVRRSIAKPHALRKNMRLLSRRSIRSWKMSHRRLQAVTDRAVSPFLSESLSP